MQDEQDVPHSQSKRGSQVSLAHENESQGDHSFDEEKSVNVLVADHAHDCAIDRM